MRKFVPVAAAIATSAAAVALPVTLAYAAAPVHVLTVTKVGGPAVKTGDVLKSGLKPKTKEVFSIGTGAQKLTCKVSSFSATVKTNPVKPGTATESLTAISSSKCTFSGITGVVFKSIKALDLPYKVSVSDATGFPTTISGTSKTKPIKFTVKVAAGTTVIVCNYKASSVKGTGSNTGNTIAFSKQKFSRAAGSNSLCATTAFLTATYGPVKDTTAMGSPKVFVN